MFNFGFFKNERNNKNNNNSKRRGLRMENLEDRFLLDAAGLLEGGCDAVLAANYKVDVQVINVTTATTGEKLDNAPTGITEIKEGETFYSELWIKSVDGTTADNGVIGGYVDMLYSNANLTVQGITYGSTTFNTFNNYADYSQAGTITMVGGAAGLGDLTEAVSQWTLFARVQYTATAAGNATISTQIQADADNNFVRLNDETLAESDVHFGSASITVKSDTPTPPTPTNYKVEVKAINVATATTGEKLDNAPTGITEVAEGDTFYTELWIKSVDGTTADNGVIGGYVDMLFSNTNLTVKSISYGSTTFNTFNNYATVSGNTITMVGGAAGLGDLTEAVDKWTLFARIEYSADAAGEATISTQIQADADNNFVRLNDETLAASDVLFGSASITITGETPTPVITGVTVDGVSKTYDGAAASVTVNGTLAGDTIVYTYNGQSSTENPTFTDAGNYAVTVKVSRAGYQDWTGSANVVIAQKQLTVSGTTVADKNYDGTTTATVTVGTVSGVVDGDTANVTATGTFASAEVGTHNVAVVYAVDNANYIAPAAATFQATIKDVPAPSEYKVEVKAINVATATTGEKLDDAPVGITEVNTGDTFFTELWIKSVDGTAVDNGVIGGYVDMLFSNTNLTVKSISYGTTTFNTFNTYATVSGNKISMVGGAAGLGDLTEATTQWTLFARIEYSADAAGEATISTQIQADADNNFVRLYDETLTENEVLFGSTSITINGYVPPAEPKLEVKVINVATATTGEKLDDAPTGITVVNKGDTFYTELWIKSIDGTSADNGVIGGYVDMLFSNTNLSVVSISYGTTTFNTFNTYASVSGDTISMVGGAAGLGDLTEAVDKWTLFARIEYSADAAGEATISTQVQEDADNNFVRLLDETLAASDVIFGSATITINNDVPQPITDVTVTGVTKTYDGAAASVIVTGIKEGDVVTYTYGTQTYTENPTFTDAGTYAVTVTVSREGYLDWSGSANVVINKADLAVPALTSVAAASSTSIAVKWGAVAGAEAYTISYAADGAAAKTVVVTGTAYTISGLTPATTYSVKIMANGNANYNESAYSAAKSATTDPAASFSVSLSTTAPGVGTVITATLDPASASAKYAWYRVDAQGAETKLTTTGNRYKVLAADLGCTLKVVATGEKGYVGQTATASTTVAVPLSTPKWAAWKVNGTEVKQVWFPVTGADSYTLIYTTDKTFSTYESVQTSSNTVYLQLTQGSTYYFKVQANDSTGKAPSSEFSEVREVKVAKLATPTITNFKGNGTTISMAWDAVQGANRYVINYATSADFKTNLKTKIINADKSGAIATSYDITGLTMGTTYWVRLQARDSTGALTTSEYAVRSVKLSKLGATTITSATASGTTANIAWTAVTGADRYIVEYSTNDFATVSKKIVNGATSVSIAKLTSGATYSFRIQARDTTGTYTTSDYSAVKTLAIPAALPQADADEFDFVLDEIDAYGEDEIFDEELFNALWD